MELEINDIPDVNKYLNVPLPKDRMPLPKDRMPLPKDRPNLPRGNPIVPSEPRPVNNNISYDDILAKMHAKFFGQQVKIVEPLKKSQMFSGEEKSVLKQSKLYNKYFKEYLDEDNEPDEIPRTREEYLKRLELDRRRLEHIRKSKSTKMLYTHQPLSNQPSTHVAKATPNNLRSMGHIFRTNRI